MERIVFVALVLSLMSLGVSLSILLPPFLIQISGAPSFDFGGSALSGNSIWFSFYNNGSAPASNIEVEFIANASEQVIGDPNTRVNEDFRDLEIIPELQPGEYTYVCFPIGCNDFREAPWPSHADNSTLACSIDIHIFCKRPIFNNYVTYDYWFNLSSQDIEAVNYYYTGS